MPKEYSMGVRTPYGDFMYKRRKRAEQRAHSLLRVALRRRYYKNRPEKFVDDLLEKTYPKKGRGLKYRK